MKELICIVCPKGCYLTVDEDHDYAVTGFSCKRGEAYGKKELINPTRVITSTVKLTGGLYARCPVKTDGEMPKGRIMEAMRVLDAVEVHSPVHIGDVVAENVLGTGVNFVATRNL